MPACRAVRPAAWTVSASESSLSAPRCVFAAGSAFHQQPVRWDGSATTDRTHFDSQLYVLVQRVEQVIVAGQCGVSTLEGVLSKGARGLSERLSLDLLR